MCLAAHGWKSLRWTFPDTSNFYCLPGRAGGPPLVVSAGAALAIARRSRRSALQLERLKFDLAQRQALAEHLNALSSRLEHFSITLWNLHTWLTAPDAAPLRLQAENVKEHLRRVQDDYAALREAWSTCQPRLTDATAREAAAGLHNSNNCVAALTAYLELTALDLQASKESSAEGSLSQAIALTPTLIRIANELDFLVRRQLRELITPGRYK